MGAAWLRTIGGCLMAVAFVWGLVLGWWQATGHQPTAVDLAAHLVALPLVLIGGSAGDRYGRRRVFVFGVALFALQLAVAQGARAIVLSSSDDKLRRTQEMGAWQTVNYRTTPSWHEEVLRLTEGRGADLVLELGGQETYDRSIASLAAGGTIAHGYLTLALLAPTGMEILVPRVRAKQILNYGLDKVRFPAPVLAGKRVRNRIKLAAAEDKGGGRWLLSLENTVEIEGGDKPALVATTLAMVFG